jgi:hypothetical protein
LYVNLSAGRPQESFRSGSSEKLLVSRGSEVPWQKISMVSRRGRHPNSLANLLPYPKGVSGNPGGKPRVDVSAIIARAIIENNAEAIYEVFLVKLAEIAGR